MENQKFSITEQEFKEFRNGSPMFIMHLIADTEEDIPEPQENWDVGSRCDMLADGGKTYLLSNAGQWEEVHFFDFGGGAAPIGILTMNLTSVTAGIGILQETQETAEM